MSTLTELLRDLLVRGVELAIEDGKLRARAADGVLSPDTLALLRGHKDEILRCLPDLRFEVPLSIGQEGLWLVRESAPDSAAYNLAFALRVESAGDHAPALRRALQRLVDRHSLLRTTFAGVDGTPRQIVRGHRAVDLREIDAAGRSWGEVLSAAADELNQPFALETEGAFRTCLFRRGAGESLLLVCAHHIAVDGWSLWMMADELLRLYEADGRANPLPPVGRTYPQFVASQRALLAERGEELRRAWAEELRDAPLVLQLPTDRPRPAHQTFRGGVVHHVVEPRVARDLRALARRSGVTLSTVFLAAFQLLLHRYTGQEDLCVGFGSAGRDHEELSATFGYMVNMLVLRARIPAEAPPSFTSLLEQTHERVLGALDRQEYPFPWLVRDLLTERDPGRAPLVQVAFVYQQRQELREVTRRLVEGSPVDVAGTRFTAESLPQLLSEHELLLEVTEGEEGVELLFRHNSDLFDAATIARMAGHLTTLLEGAAADPGRPVSELPLLPAAEREELLATWNRTEAPFSSEACIHQLFEAHVDRAPEAIALVDLCDPEAGSRGVRITYRELEERANQVAHRLRRLGVGPDTRVALHLERGAELIVGLLGILKAGGAFVVLDPEHPKQRLSFLLEDTAVQVVLGRASLLATLPATSARVVDIDRDLRDEPTHRPESGAGPTHLAYVLYTSGSTGEPNGVLIEHRGIVNVVEAASRLLSMGPDTRFAHALSFNFDGALFNLFCVICAGGSLHLASREGDFLGRGLVEVMEREEITHTLLVPGMLSALPDAALPSLHTLMVGGERCPAELVTRWGSGRRFFNLYGPTEASIWATFARCLPDGQPPPIGHLIPNLQGFVMDDRGQLAPPGVPGELVLGGVGLARGYLNRPELTARKFIDNPFGEGRLYRTGDRVRHRMTEGGPPVLEFLSRLDNQVKVRGHRIELSEVENALCASPLVRDAVVTVKEGAAGEVAQSRLIAHVTLATPDQPQQQEQAEDSPRGPSHREIADRLRRELREVLPLYLVPSAIVVLPALPLNINGKVDVRALPPPEAPGDAGALETEPRNAVERELAGMWREVLGLDRVSIHDDFFGLGGQSLLAARVISRLPQVFGLKLPLRTLFDNPTIAELAAHIDALRAAGGRGQDEGSGAHDALRAMPHTGTLPASPAQRGLWFLSQLAGANVAYNIPLVTELRGPLDEGALSRALDEIVRRHESLRTTFRRDAEGRPVQVIHPPAHIAVPRDDLGHLDAAAREAETSRCIDREVHGAFDVERGPLLRARLVRLAEDHHLFSLVIHHLVGDGWSIGVLGRELRALYGAFTSSRPSPLPDLPLQYADVSRWQQERSSGAAAEAHVAYWKQKLAGVQTLQLPTDRPRPAEESFRGSHHVFFIGQELTRALRELSREEGVTLFATLLAAFDVLLARHAGQDDVAVATASANRPHPALEDLIGYFVNTVVRRCDLADDPAFRELLGRVHASLLDDAEHEELPFERVLSALRPERTGSQSPLARVMLSLQGFSRLSVALPGLEAAPWDGLRLRAVKFDLAFLLSEVNGGLEVAIEHSSDLFDRPTIERLGARYETLLGSIVRDRSRRVGQLDLLPAAEREQILVEWNRTAMDHDRASSLHALFEAQAARTPEAPAVYFEDRVVSYGELNRRANKLAHHLRRAGVVAETRVGVCVDRSVEMIVSLLGVLKSGGAYVPIDPAYPLSRQELILADSGARLLVTRGGLGDRLAVAGRKVVALDRDAATIAAERDADPEERVPGDRLAYIIYTSGSTGGPKGVAAEHRNAVASLHAIRAQYSAEDLKGVSACMSICFDYSVLEIFLPLIAGGATILAADSLALAEHPARSRVRLLSIVPSAMTELLRAGAVPRGVRAIDVGAERVSNELIQRIHRETTAERVYNVYGPTETTVYCTYYLTQRGAEHEPPIGRPMANSQLYILDRWLQPVPIGVAGEIHIGGEGVSRGYWNRPELTAERFVQSPFGPGRLYKTGDLARFRADGEVEFLGRADHQIKLRGFRIELGEIESALERLPGVDKALVVADGAPPRQRLVAYWLAAPGPEQPGKEEMRAGLAAKLPVYMVPEVYVRLDAFPLGASGKIDRRALPSPSDTDLRRREYEAPRTPTEQQLAAIWREVLDLQRVGLHDDFFGLGGQSLLAVQVISRLPQVFGLELPLRAVFDRPTIAELAAHIDAARATLQLVARPRGPVALHLESGEL